MKYSETINDILDFFEDAEISYKKAIDTRNETEAEIQDLLHELELEELSYHDKGKVVKELTELRKERRMAKYTIQQLDPVMIFKRNNSKAIEALGRCYDDVLKQERLTDPESVVYNRRTDVIERVLNR